MKIILNALATVFLLVSGQVQADQIRLDHVIVAVNDIYEAVETYQNLGFTIKPGKVHKNGLINSHIKFPNRTGLELMSIAGVVKDDVARKYADILKFGDGGAYIAFSVASQKKVVEKLKMLGIDHQVKTGRLWDYITFYDEPDFEHLFFIDAHHASIDDLSVLRHKNGSSHINGIWFEAAAKVRRLLEAFGAISCGKMANESFPGGDVYRIGNTVLVTVPPRLKGKRPRILGLSFHASRLDYTSDAHGIWVKGHSDFMCAASTPNSQIQPTQ